MAFIPSAPGQCNISERRRKTSYQHLSINPQNVNNRRHPKIASPYKVHSRELISSSAAETVDEHLSPHNRSLEQNPYYSALIAHSACTESDVTVGQANNMPVSGLESVCLPLNEKADGIVCRTEFLAYDPNLSSNPTSSDTIVLKPSKLAVPFTVVRAGVARRSNRISAVLPLAKGVDHISVNHKHHNATTGCCL